MRINFNTYIYKAVRCLKSLSSGACLCLYAAVALCLLLATSCGTKKNTPLSRNWQAFTTRYNVYYNGSEHYKEQIKQLEAEYEDDYSRTLLTHPSEARADQKLPQPKGDFKRTIEKMQKSIQLHSIKKKPRKKSGSAKEKAFRARDEFNPFLHNAWMLMGKAQYHNGDFLGAASTFMYISKHFTWLPKTVTEARLWQARAYSALGWNYETENVLRLVKEKDLVDKSLRNLYNLTQAGYYVRSEKYAEAIPYLKAAAQSAHGSQKNRLWFLLGQLYSHEDRKAEAYAAYRKAGSGASTAYRTKFNARIKQSEVYTGKNIKGEVNALKAMTRYQRNKEFLDQIYYAIGNLYLSRNDTAKAKENYILSVEKSTRNAIDKALSNLALGNIYFAEGDYVKAQPCYAEAVPQLSDNYPDYKLLKKRSDVLDELALYAGNVQLQDSLLRLSKMTPEEREKVCQKIVDELVKKEKEEAEAAKKEAYLQEQADKNGIRPNGNAPQSFQMNTDKSWYFYNTMAKNTGKTEFQKRWGARKLEDDWRRRNKTSFSFDDDTDNSDGDSEEAPNDSITPEMKEKADHENDPHYVEYYLKQIPTTEEEIKTANDIIQEGLYNLGLILKDKLSDFPAATHEFITLNDRYPDNIYRLDTYYNLYLMAMRSGNSTEAEKWHAMILDQFPESPYGEAMRDPAYFDNLRRMNEIQEQMYSRAYDAYLNNDNSEVHSLTGEMEKDYPLSKILPKFVFIDALSYLTEKDNAKFQERLEELLRKWPQTDMTDMAGSIVKGLKAGRKPHAGLGNAKGMIWTMRLSNDENMPQADGQPANFDLDPEKPQYLVYVFPRDSINANQLLYEVARFNFSSFVVKDFDLEPMSFGNVGLLIVKGFVNMKELENYRATMAKYKFEFPEEVRPVMISKANFELLLREGRSFEEYFRFQEQKSVEQTEAGVVGEDRTMPPGPEGEAGVDETPQEEPENSVPEETETPAPAPAVPDMTPEEVSEEILEEDNLQ